jgi:hypothetical protein
VPDGASRYTGKQNIHRSIVKDKTVAGVMGKTAAYVQGSAVRGKSVYQMAGIHEGMMK